MKFYRVSISESAPNRYAWASGYGPIEIMPFIRSYSDEIREMKLASWELNEPHPGINIDRGGREWSDILGCGGGPPYQFFSERVIDSLRNERIEFLRCSEMPIGKIHSKQLLEIPSPKYFVLEADPGLQIRSESVPIAEQVAARNSPGSPWVVPYRTKGVLETWNGADLFSPAHGKSLTSLFCTDRVKELGLREGWTNILFDPIEMV